MKWFIMMFQNRDATYKRARFMNIQKAIPCRAPHLHFKANWLHDLLGKEHRGNYRSIGESFFFFQEKVANRSLTGCFKDANAFIKIQKDANVSLPKKEPPSYKDQSMKYSALWSTESCVISKQFVFVYHCMTITCYCTSN